MDFQNQIDVNGVKKKQKTHNLSVEYATDDLSLKWRLLTRHRLSDGYEKIRRLSDACGHIYKKNKLSLWFLVSLKREIHTPSDFGSKCSSDPIK